MFAALLAITLLTTPPPPDQTLIFYNARLALRDKEPKQALRLWLLHNSLVNRGERAPEAEDFRSVAWAALGDLGLCSDGFRKDDHGGAGLWPLGMHNWLLHFAARGEPLAPVDPWDAFEVGRQQRFVSMQDVLDRSELKSVSFFPTPCFRSGLMLYSQDQVPWGDVSDRLVSGPLLQHLLRESLKTLDREKVQSTAAIEVRLFHLDLAMAALWARKARQEGSETKARARSVGVSLPGAEEARAAAAKWPPDSPQAKFLRRALAWPASDWLMLSSKERLFLFGQARPFLTEPGARRRFVLGMVDALLERSPAGAEVESWLGEWTEEEAPGLRGEVTQGARGARLLELEESSGFQDRAVVALYRGIAFLEAGDRQSALRSFAFALAHSEQGHDRAVVLGLSRRWLGYVLARYQTDAEVVATLRALIPAQEYNAVLEDLVWRAALRADRASFEMISKGARHGGSFDALLDRLRPLSRGEAGGLMTELRNGAEAQPYSTLRFLKQLLGKYEVEDADVRRANVPVLQLMLGVLDSISKRAGNRGSNARNSDELIGRTQAILDGLDTLDSSAVGRARAIGPGHETFAGNIRLAPADPLPWPFSPPETEPPSAFVPMVLKPVEWRDRKGALVFGWRITDEGA